MTDTTDLYTGATDTLYDAPDTADEATEDIPAEEVETVDRVEVDAVLETAVDSTLAAVRKNLLENASDTKVRKAILLLPTERRKARRRNVDTDVPVSELVFDAVLDLLNKEGEIHVATTRAAKNRTDRLTLTAPAWWWSLVGLAADANDGTPADVISTAISKHLS